MKQNYTSSPTPKTQRSWAWFAVLQNGASSMCIQNHPSAFYTSRLLGIYQSTKRESAVLILAVFLDTADSFAFKNTANLLLDELELAFLGQSHAFFVCPLVKYPSYRSIVYSL